jgi:hypothetical protein
MVKPDQDMFSVTLGSFPVWLRHKVTMLCTYHFGGNVKFKKHIKFQKYLISHLSKPPVQLVRGIVSRGGESRGA